MNNKYNIGDKVRDLVIELLTIKGVIVYGDGCYQYEVEENDGIYDEEVLTPYIEEDKTKEKFKKDDNVRAIGALAIDGEHNRLGVIQRVIGEESWVLWETDIGQFSCRVMNSNLELIEPNTIEEDTPKIKLRCVKCVKDFEVTVDEFFSIDKAQCPICKKSEHIYQLCGDTPYIYEDGVLKYNKSTSIYPCPICNEEIKYNFYGSEFGFICEKCNDKKIPQTDTTIQIDSIPNVKDSETILDSYPQEHIGMPEGRFVYKERPPVGLDYEAKDDLVNRIIVIVAAGINDESLFEECLKDIISQYDISELI